IRSLELLAAQEKAQLAGRELGAHARLRLGALGERVITAFIRGVGPAVPDDDVAGAVLLGGDHALERGVVERVVLDLHRHALVCRIERRTLRYRPRLQHAVEFEPKVVVQAPGGMLLHHEQQWPVPRAHALRRRLGRTAEGALGGIALQGALAHSCASIHSAAARSSAPRTSASRPTLAGT